MKIIIQELQQKVIIGDREIQKIHRYIEGKYRSYTPKQKEQAWVYITLRYVAKKLEPFSDEHKRCILQQLSRIITLGSTIKPLYADDILRACLMVQPKEEMFFACMICWMNENQKHIFPTEAMNVFLEQVETYGIHLGDQTLGETVTILEQKVAQARQTLVLNSSIREIMKNIERKIFHKKGQSIACMLCIIMLIFSFLYRAEPRHMMIADAIGAEPPIYIDPQQEEILHQEESPLPPDLQYKQIDPEDLREWLQKRGSILEEEPYFSAILDGAKEHNIHPLFLFAIVGQEQGFVLRSHPRAEEIANNPFNVFESWQKYNTTIADSVQIACKTILRLSKGRPPYEEPIRWINSRGGQGGYAVDENWTKGVSLLFNQLNKVVDLWVEDVTQEETDVEYRE